MAEKVDWGGATATEGVESEGVTELDLGGAVKLDSRGTTEAEIVDSAGAEDVAGIDLEVAGAVARNELTPVAPPEGKISRS